MAVLAYIWRLSREINTTRDGLCDVAVTRTQRLPACCRLDLEKIVARSKYGRCEIGGRFTIRCEGIAWLAAVFPGSAQQEHDAPSVARQNEITRTPPANIPAYPCWRKPGIKPRHLAGHGLHSERGANTPFAANADSQQGSQHEGRRDIVRWIEGQSEFLTALSFRHGPATTGIIPSAALPFLKSFPLARRGLSGLSQTGIQPMRLSRVRSTTSA
jgi:hypothetical protein